MASTLHPPALAGFERPLLYLEEHDRFVEDDRHLATEHAVHDPYFAYTDRGEKPFVTQTLVGGQILKIGRIGAFSDEELARLIRDQVTEYVYAGTMGVYPAEDVTTNRQLMAAMISGFTAERIVVSLEHHTPEGVVPLAGVQAQRGQSEGNLAFGLKDPNGDISTLAPFTALYPKVEPQDLATLAKFINCHGGKPELHAVAMSRLFRRSKDLLLYTGDGDLRGLGAICMAALAIGIHRSNQDLGNDHKEDVVIYDTHIAELAAMLESVFTMSTIVNHGNLAATSEVKKSVLAHHYDAEANGGFLERIVLGHGSVKSYHSRAVHYLNEKVDSHIV